MLELLRAVERADVHRAHLGIGDELRHPPHGRVVVTGDQYIELGPSGFAFNEGAGKGCVEGALPRSGTQTTT